MKRAIFCAIIIVCFSYVASATHLRGGHISIKQLGKTSLTCRITITVYTNTNGTDVLFGGTKFQDGDLLDFGDGTIPKLVPEVGPLTTPPGSTYSVIDVIRGISRATFTVDYTYSEPGTYKVSYQEHNRNIGIINLDQSVNTPIYLESSFTLDPFADKPYSSPSFISEPSFYAATDGNLTYSMAAQDSNDYLLLYELTSPKMSKTEHVLNYRLPEAFSINQFIGLITWDTKFQERYQVGEFSFAAKVYQVKNNLIIGYVVFDFQIILEDSYFNGTLSDNIDLDENNRIYVQQGDTFTFKVFAEDSDLPSLEALSELSSHSELFSFTSYDSMEGARNIKVGVMSIKSGAEILRDNPYAVAVRAAYPSGKYSKDLSYLFYTKDIEIPGLDIILGVAEPEELPVRVYPNPVKDFLKIEGGLEKFKTIKLISVNGQLILERNNFKEDTLDLRSLPTGVYILQIGAKGFIQKTFRLIKSK